MSDGVLKFKAFNYDLKQVLKSRNLDTKGKAQQHIDSEVLRLSEPFVPKDIAAASQGGNLIQSGIMNTEIGSGEVKYNTPYARRWYYMPAHFQQDGGGTAVIGGKIGPGRGSYWFERFKQQYRNQVLNGVKQITKSK